jgi:hypothetical protein
VIFRPKSDAFE